MSFVHLHTHSSYSPMAGLPSLEALCLAAVHQGATSLALTDTNGLYGAIRFVSVAREAGLRPILGAEVQHNGHRAVLLATSPEGYANLCRILSAVQCDAACHLIGCIATHRTGLVILSDDQRALTCWKRDAREDLYVELTPGALMHQALAYSRDADLPPVATTRAYFLHPRDYRLHRLLRAIALNTTLSRLPEDACCAATHWLMSPEDLARQFPHCPQALTNTERVAEQCHTDWDFNTVIFPQFRRLGHEEAYERLKKKTWDGARWRYGTVTPIVRSRMEHELRIIREKHYAHYFLVVDEIVQQAPRTCGRGSAAASIVAYCLGITHVDPIQHNLFFERFLSPGRQDPPDIDIDFPWDERDRIVDWVMARYGAHSAAMVANQNMLGVRGALREVAKVYGLPADDIKRTTDRIGRLAALFHRERQTAEQWMERVTAGLGLRPPWPTIIRDAIQLDEQFRHLSLHCGGVVIVPDEIRRYVPVEISAKGLPVIQWEKHQTEEAGLVKIDLLGNRSLAVIRDAVAAIAAHTGRHIDYATWDPAADSATQELIRRGDTMGCFYIESPATRMLLKKLWRPMPPHRREQADVFDYLTIASSLVRPAANTFVDEFLERAHGKVHVPLHPQMEELLAETFGIMVYQEDVTKVAMAVAGFSIEDGDQLRKVLSKKHKRKRLADFYRQFVHGATERGTPPDIIEHIWAMILSFAGYSFCKPHSASYAQVSMKSAYLRAHYPAEFLAAVMSNQGGFYSLYAYVSEARRMGLTVLPPNLNASGWASMGADRTIRLGFMHLKGIQREFVERCVAEREQRGPYRSFADWLHRVQPDTHQARLFIKAGCCTSVAGELTRPAMIWRLLAHHAQKSADGVSLFEPPTTPTRALPIPDEYDEAEQVANEDRAFGFALRGHPLDGCVRDPTARLIYGNELDRHVGEVVTLEGWLLTEKPAETKKGEPMTFLTFEDRTAIYDVTMFPKTFLRYGHLLQSHTGYVVHGDVEAAFEVVTITLRHLRQLVITHDVHPTSDEHGSQKVC